VRVIFKDGRMVRIDGRTREARILRGLARMGVGYLHAWTYKIKRLLPALERLRELGIIEFSISWGDPMSSVFAKFTDEVETVEE